MSLTNHYLLGDASGILKILRVTHLEVPAELCGGVELDHTLEKWPWGVRVDITRGFCQENLGILRPRRLFARAICSSLVRPEA